jgi:hypothetical protein
MTNKKYSVITYDWKDSPSLEQLQSALEPFGVLVYEDPSVAGSDSYGFVFSNKKLTNQDLEEIGSRFEDEDYDGD